MMSHIVTKAIRYFKRKKIKRIRPEQPPLILADTYAYKQFKRLPDDKLYCDNEFCLHYLKHDLMNVKEKPEKTGQLFHAYWHGLISEKQVFPILSVLATQPDSSVWLWIDKKSWKMNENNVVLQQLKNHIEIKCYDVFAEIKNTPFETFDRLHWSQYIDLAMRGDTFRILILYKYKGVYFDLDMFFLRDLGTLYQDNIIYCWENQNYCNSALLFLKSGKIMDNIVTSVKEFNTFIPWVIFNYNNVKIKELLVYPCTFFDPVWKITNKDNYMYPLLSFDDFFTKKCDMETYKDFFPGAYTYHWHNRWNMEPVVGSFFDVFNKELSQKILKK